VSRMADCHVSQNWCNRMSHNSIRPERLVPRPKSSVL
jgi:hypothetical protein